MARYELIEHTADIGLRIYAPDLEGLFVCGAKGLFDIMVDSKNIRPRKSYPVEVRAPDLEELLVAWFREILFLFTAKEIALCRFNIEQIVPGLDRAEQTPKARPGGQEGHLAVQGGQAQDSDKCRLKAITYGEKLDLNRHQVRAEVKAVTYHQLKVEHKGGEWIAEVIFDV